MTSAARDKWAEWLLERRHGGDVKARDATIQHLAPVRDRVLDAAGVREGDVVLDVGCGDGLIAFGALDGVGESGRVIFSDVSQDLLDRSRQLADEAGALERCEFVRAAAQDLGAIADATVDVVTTRSVVIYVPFEEKPRAFREFFRVLRSGGRLSMFEPINRFGYPEPEDRFFGFDVGPIRDLAAKVRTAYEGAGEETLIDFDERDLIAFADAAGFTTIELDYEAKFAKGDDPRWESAPRWDVFIRGSGNPCAPTLDEAMARTLSLDERERFEGYLRPLFEDRKATMRSAVAYLRAAKR